MSFLIGVIVGGVAAAAGCVVWQRARSWRLPLDNDRPEPYAEMAIAEGSLGTWEFDAQTFQVTGNRRHMEFWGFPASGSRYSMRTVWDHVESGDRRRVRGAFIRALSDGQPFEIEFGVRTTEGRRRILWIEGHVSRNEDGSPRSIFGLSRDRTEERDTEDRLREERHQLAFTMRVGGIGAWEYDPESETHTWDDTAASLFEWSPGPGKAAPHEWFLAHLVPDDRARFDAKILARRLTGKADYEDQVRFRTDSGTTRTLRLVGRFTGGEDGARPHFRGALWDMTREIAEREAARIDKERLTLAMGAGGIGTWEFHPARAVHVWDKTTFEMFGLPFDEERNEVPHAQVHAQTDPADLPQMEAALAHCQETGTQDFDVRFRFTTADGRKLHIRSAGHFVPARAGEAAYFYGVHWDQTEIFTQRRELEFAKARLELALAAAELGTWQVDPSTMEVKLDTRSASILKHSAAPADRLVPVEHSFLHPEDRERNLAAMRSALVTGDVLALETRAVRGDGRMIWLKVRGRSVNDPEGRTLLLGTLEDISDARANADRLERALIAAQSADRAKSAFLASMSHEIRTPLNAIIGFAQVLSRNEEVPARARRQIHTINEAGRHLLELLDEVLDLSKIEAGAMKLEPGPTDLRRLLDEAVRLFEARAQRMGLRLTFRFPDHRLPPLLVDRGKLRQVVQNLIGNAIKFTNEGTVQIELEAPEWDGSEELSVGSPLPVRIRVEDTGPGMTREELDSLFDAFVQGTAGKRVQAGSGLGLAISKRLVELMGGQLRAESTVGRGSEFTLEFAPVLAPHAPDPVRAVRPPVVRLVPSDEGTAVLVVDDNISNRAVLNDLLTDVGFAVIEAADGCAGVELWRQHHHPIILMDLIMSGMDGFEATRKIRALPGGGEVAIIAVSASMGAEGPAMSKAAGADGFVHKPVRAERLFNLMEDTGAVVFDRHEKASAAGLTRNPFAPSIDTLQGQMQSLPPAARDEMQRLVEALDFDAIGRFVRELDATPPALRDHLLAAVERFDHDHLLSLLRS